MRSDRRRLTMRRAQSRCGCHPPSCLIQGASCCPSSKYNGGELTSNEQLPSDAPRYQHPAGVALEPSTPPPPSPWQAAGANREVREPGWGLHSPQGASEHADGYAAQGKGQGERTDLCPCWQETCREGPACSEELGVLGVPQRVLWGRDAARRGLPEGRPFSSEETQEAPSNPNDRAHDPHETEGRCKGARSSTSLAPFDDQAGNSWHDRVRATNSGVI